MKPRDISLTLALCGSLIAHAVITEILAEAYIRHAGQIYLPGSPASLGSLPAADDSEPKLGASAGVGDAVDDSTGELPQQAQQADQAQAFLGLDPQGVKAASAQQSALQQSSPAPATPPVEQASASPFGLPGDADDLRTGPRDAKPAAPAPQPSEAETSSASSAAPTGAPAEQAATESDPVAVVGSAQFRPGKTDIQYGRSHKITRPHLSLAAQADLMSLAAPLLTLKLTIDPTGHVESVAIFKSSGSPNIDEGVKLAAYNWWFEPAKDHAGKVRGDVILFSVRFI